MTRRSRRSISARRTTSKSRSATSRPCASASVAPSRGATSSSRATWRPTRKPNAEPASWSSRSRAAGASSWRSFSASITRSSPPANGDEALALLQQDQVRPGHRRRNLPGMSGLRVIEQAQRLLPHCASVLYTAYPSYETVKEAFELGVDAYLVRPNQDLEVPEPRRWLAPCAAAAAFCWADSEASPSSAATSSPTFSKTVRDLVDGSGRFLVKSWFAESEPWRATSTA